MELHRSRRGNMILLCGQLVQIMVSDRGGASLGCIERLRGLSKSEETARDLLIDEVKELEDEELVSRACKQSLGFLHECKIG